jgi:hypothetical protein
MYFDKQDDDERTSGHETIHDIVEVYFKGNDCIFRASCGRDFILTRGDIQKNPFSILPVPKAIRESINESPKGFSVTIHQATHDKIMNWLKFQQEISMPDTTPEKKSFPFIRLAICLITVICWMIFLIRGTRPLPQNWLLIPLIILFFVSMAAVISLYVEKSSERK